MAKGLERIDLIFDLAPQGFSSEDVEVLLTSKKRGASADEKGRVAEERVWRLLGRMTQEEGVSFRRATEEEERRKIDLVITRVGQEEIYIPIQVKASLRGATRFRKQMKKEGRRIPVVVAGGRQITRASYLD